MTLEKKWGLPTHEIHLSLNDYGKRLEKLHIGEAL